MLKWIAYPIHHPGAKMKTTLVIHGPQGTGKNMFFEALMSIYGRYGRVIDQTAIEAQFNDWASRKLFLIADEVVARSDLYHVKNKLKAFITGDWIRINPKNVAPYDERNHVNVVFLSNEAQPVILEEDDRRHAVIWTPEKLPPEFYGGLIKEIENGGAAALHDYLLKLDLGSFTTGTLPPITKAKKELINMSLDSTSRFYLEFVERDIGGINYMPCLSNDLYELYQVWCKQAGVKAGPRNRLINVLARKHKQPAARKRYKDKKQQPYGPHSVLMFGEEAPPGGDEQMWLGGHIERFKKLVCDYKEAAKDNAKSEWGAAND